jgi:hypothetical protein
VTVGIASAQATDVLNLYRNTAGTARTPFVQLHTADPGAAGTTAVAAVTTRNAITWNAPSAGSMTLLALSDYTGVSSETITHVSLWTASTAGTFLQSFALTASQAIILNSILHFNSFTVALTPIAA